MTASFVQIAYLFLAPALGFVMARRYMWASKLGVVVLSYGFGILLSAWPAVQADLSQSVGNIAIPLAIPLLLFNLNVRAWLSSAPDTLKGFLLCLIALLISATSAALLFSSSLEQASDIAGILTGLYSGGSPNAAVVHQALGASPLLYTQINAVDMVTGSIYFLFLISLAGPVFGLFLHPYAAPQLPARTSHSSENVFAFGDSLLALGVASLIVAVTLGTVRGLNGSLHVSGVMLGITSLAIAASNWPRLRAVKSSYPMGYYFVAVFCCAIASQLKLEQLDGEVFTVGAMQLCVLLGAIILHLFFARLAKLDRDTTIITQTAALYGPPFVPPVAGALNNPAILLSGLTTGLVGYALGNYLGIALALALR